MYKRQPQALVKIKKLEAERDGFASMTLRMEAQLQHKDQELERMGNELAQSRQREAEKDAYIATLLEHVAQGVKKGWQVEELQRMIFGRRSERFVPVEGEKPAATQLVLGDDFSTPCDLTTTDTPDETTGDMYGSKEVTSPVSYTHLDVYKRQI